MPEVNGRYMGDDIYAIGRVFVSLESLFARHRETDFGDGMEILRSIIYSVSPEVRLCEEHYKQKLKATVEKLTGAAGE